LFYSYLKLFNLTAEITTSERKFRMKSHLVKTLLNYLSKRNWLVIALLFLLVELFIWPTGEFPLNDDWSYSRSVEAYVNYGKIQFSDWVAIPFVSQYLIGIFFSKVFGFSFFSLRLGSIVLSFLMIFIFDKLLKSLSVRDYFRFFINLLLVFNPLFLTMGNTFLPDTYTLFFALCSFYFMIKYILENKSLNFILFIICTLLGTMTRQTGILLPFLFSLIFFFSKKKTLKNILISFTPFLVNFLTLFTFEKSAKYYDILPKTYNLQLNAIIDILQHFSINSFLYISLNFLLATICLGIFILPITISNFKFHLNQIKNSIISKVLLLLFIVLLIVKPLLTIHILPFNGNIFFFTGIGPVIMTGLNTQAVTEISLTVRIISVILHLMGGVSFFVAFHAIILWIINSIKKKTVFFPIFFVLLLFGYLTPICFNYANDRYLLLLIPFFFISYLLSVTFKLKKLGFSLIFIPIFFFSVIGVRDYFSINNSRWKALDYLTTIQHITPYKIDGGFEFNAWHLYGKANYKTRHNNRWWFIDDDEYIISPQKKDGYTIEKKFPLKSIMTYSYDQMYILKRK